MALPASQKDSCKVFYHPFSELVPYTTEESASDLEAALSWALSQPGTEVIVDDLAARRCAQELGVPCRGCLALVLLAKRHGILPVARPVSESMRATELRLSDRVMNQALGLVDE
jgi:predicted nucleic acid-binding protein